MHTYTATITWQRDPASIFTDKRYSRAVIDVQGKWDYKVA